MWNPDAPTYNHPQNQKWMFPLNDFGFTAPVNSQLIMIAEAWEDGDFNTKHLEDDYHQMIRTYFTPRIYPKGYYEGNNSSRFVKR